MAAHPTQPPPKLNEGEVASAISGYFGVSPGDSAVSRLLSVVFPDVERAAARDPASWKSVFPTVLAKYESLAKELGLGISPVQRELDAARNANPTGAGPLGIATQFATRLRADAPLSLREDASSGRVAERATAAAIGRDAPLTVNGAIAYAREIGANPAFASFFVGGSQEMRDALRSAIRDGAAIADDKVKSMRDVSMVLGAIRSGKLKPDDPKIPPSVRSIIDDMKSKGIDPATTDPKKVKKYLDSHPDALNAARKKADQSLTATSGRTDASIETSLEAKAKAKAAGRADQTGDDSSRTAKVKPPGP